MKKYILILILISPFFSQAGWHSGEINMIAIGYDGNTISIGQEDFSKSNCTCYPTWPNRACLDRSRASFNEEYALILSAKARNVPVSININEATCQVVAIYENQ